jgi:hypothetical protein
MIEGCSEREGATTARDPRAPPAVIRHQPLPSLPRFARCTADDTSSLIMLRLRERLDHHHAVHAHAPWRLEMSVGVVRVAPAMHPGVDDLLAQAAAAALAERQRIG